MYVCACVCVCVCVRVQRRDAAATELCYKIKFDYKYDIVCISRCKHATNHQIVTRSYDLHVSFDRFACVF